MSSKLARLLSLQFARFHAQSAISLSNGETAQEETIENISSLTIEELEMFAETFHLSSEELLQVEKLSRQDINLATSHFTRLICTKHANKPKKRVVRGIRAMLPDTMKESFHTAIAEQAIDVSKYVFVGYIAHNIDFSHIVPFLNDHIVESIGTFLVVSIVAFFASRLSEEKE